MQKILRFVLAGLVLLILLSFMAAFTVRFTEAAVVTTFGKASQGAVKRDAGLYFKWPYPIQSYTKYDIRGRQLELKIETQQTKDNRQVAVEAFCTWRVSDPLKFFQTFSQGERAEEHYRKAEEALRANLRAAAGVVSNYTMNDLFTTASGQSRLPELEARMLEAFRQASDQRGSKLDDYGVEAVEVGLKRILLPEEVTRAVFDRMKSSRDRIAKEIETQGQSQAQAIREKASSDAKRITAFAEQLAQKIRNQGDLEAAPYFKALSENPQLAIFDMNMQFYRDVNPRTTTLVLSSTLPGMDLLMPNALAGLKSGEVPALSSARLAEAMRTLQQKAQQDAQEGAR